MSASWLSDHWSPGSWVSRSWLWETTYSPLPGWVPALPLLAWATLPVLGAGYAVLRDLGVFHSTNRTGTPRVVVITGGTKGLGLALAKTHLTLGDRVVLCGSSAASVAAAQELFGPELYSPASGEGKVVVMQADVTSGEDMDALMAAGVAAFGAIDLVYANAGKSVGERGPLHALEASEIADVVNVNLVGALLTYRAAVRAMEETPSSSRMVVCLVAGAGTEGRATQEFAPYGASKGGYLQIVKTLGKELKTHVPVAIGVHMVQPGMIITDLLLHNKPEDEIEDRLRFVFNVLAERPETVAQWIVPRVRALPATRSGIYLRYLTTTSVIWRFLTFPWRKNRLIQPPSSGPVGDGGDDAASASQ